MQRFVQQLRNKGVKMPPVGSGPQKGAGMALTGFAVVSYGLYSSLFTVPTGHSGVVFNKFPWKGGVSKEVFEEGTHLIAPFFQESYIFDIRRRPKIFKSFTGTKDLQMVDITLRVLYKPVKEELPWILSQLGTDYDKRVLESIANETLKSVVAQFNADQLIRKREQVSQLIRRHLTERAKDFNIIIDDVSITHSTFGREYTKAVEDKQVAEQDAQRAKYQVKQALQDKQSTIIRAQGEAESAAMIGKALKENPGYLQLRQLDAARTVADTVSQSKNSVVLDSESLLLNVLDDGKMQERLRGK